mgnify:CR=1 FL=1
MLAAQWAADRGVRVYTVGVGTVEGTKAARLFLADATQRRVEVSPEREATTLGAAYAAGLAIGAWPDDDAIAASWDPAEVVEPVGTFDRERWADTLRRAEKWFPDLSAISF